MLKLAKERHRQVYGEAPLNRVKIRKFKKEIRKQILGESDSSESI